ncbi:MAG TPA: SAM-dependent methyltransferase [Ignavibacteria bacterium]|jgi:16S rRNA (cytidine1402-2'-O)-methyltransferase
MQKGKLYLIPVTIGGSLTYSVPQGNLELINKIDYYIVENVKSAISFLKSSGLDKSLHDLHFFEYSKKRKEKNLNDYMKPAMEGNDMALMSESGMPCIGDPGEEIVSLAHEMDIKVVPLVGPSSILLSLIASGLNAENFSFNGYLPIGKNPRLKKIKELEKKIYTENQTQIFIEAPQRNDRLVEDILSVCNPSLKLCIAKNITMNDELIETKPIHSWKRSKIVWGKNPIIFLLGK